MTQSSDTGHVTIDAGEALKILDKIQAGVKEFQQLLAGGIAAPPVENNTNTTIAQQILKANEKPTTNCKDVADGMKNFKVHGFVTQNIEREVNTKRGPTKIRDVNLDDKTAVMRITFWNPGKVPAELKTGDEVTIEGLMGKPPYNGSPQASGGDYAKITSEKTV